MNVRSKWMIGIASILALLCSGLVSAHPITSEVDSREALVWGNEQTYAIDAQGLPAPLPQVAIAMIGATTTSGGKILASASFEGFGVGNTSYGWDNDLIPELDEFHNKRLLTNAVRWLVGPPPKSILFSGWWQSYHQNTINHLRALGYSVTWGGAAPALTLARLQGFDMFMGSCQALGPYLSADNPATETAVVDYVDGGGKVWFLGHYGGHQSVTGIHNCHQACDRISTNNVVRHFGIEYMENTMYHPTDFNGFPVNPVYRNFAPNHPVTRLLRAVTFDGGSSLRGFPLPVPHVMSVTP